MKTANYLLGLYIVMSMVLLPFSVAGDSNNAIKFTVIDSQNNQFDWFGQVSPIISQAYYTSKSSESDSPEETFNDSEALKEFNTKVQLIKDKIIKSPKITYRLSNITTTSSSDYLWLASGSSAPGYTTKIYTNGTLVSQFSGPESPVGITWDGTYLWEASVLRRIYQMTTSGQEISHFFGPYAPTGLVWDGTYLWLATWSSTNSSLNRVYKLTTTGEVVSYFPTPGGDFSLGLTYADDYLWLADMDDNYIYKLTTSGSVVGGFAFSYPVGLAWDGQYFWISTPGDSIHKVTTSGSIVESFTSPVDFIWDMQWVSGGTPCVCTSGTCCDGCNYRSTTYKCQEDVTTDYECADGTNCGQDVYVRHQDKYCSGSSTGCDGALQWDTPVVYDDCTTTEKCANDDSSCNYDAVCACVCTSGTCCDGCNYRPTTYKCQEDVTTDYGCPWGTACSNDVGVQHQDKYCSGTSSGCDGALQWDAWALADDCTTTEKCADNDATCNYDFGCEVIACDSNSDCGTDGWVDSPWCSNNDLYQNYRTYICNNPGTPSSYCSNSDSAQLRSDCGDDYCDGWGGNSCRDNDVYHSRTCYDKGCSGSSCFNNPYTDEQKVQECGNSYCDGWGTNYCIGNSVYHNRTCYNLGCSGNSCFYNSYFNEGLVGNCQYGCGGGLCLGQCENGIKDSDELGIDCGGSCANQDCCNNNYQDNNLGETGVDCGGSCHYSCIVPVILVHGYNVVDPMSETWSVMKQRLENDGFTVEVMDLEVSNVPARGNISRYSEVLKNRIRYVKNQYNAKYVDIVAHSMGGLVSRGYTRRSDLYQDDVRKLVMLGTPNHGSELTNYFYLFAEAYKGVTGTNVAGKAFFQMKPGNDFLNSLNCDNPHRENCEDITTSGIYQYTIAGTNGGLGSWVLPGEDDGFVAVNSVKLDLIEQANFGSNHEGLHNDIQPYNEVRYILENNFESQTAPLQQKSFGIEPIPQQLASISGNLSQSQGKNHTVYLQNIDAVEFILGNFNGTLNFTLIDSNGTLIDPNNAAFFNITYEDGDYTQAYEIGNPLQGEWTLNVFGYNVTENVEYLIYTFVESSMSMDVSLSDYVLHSNQQLTITAELKNDTNPITNANIVVNIIKPDTSENLIYLYDDGTHNDLIANDGNYTNVYTETNINGEYDLTVTANGTNFEREKVSSFWVEEYPDLVVDNITFSDDTPYVGDNVTIEAVINNLLNVSAYNAAIEFYYNGQYEDILIGNATVDISGLGTETVSVVWAPDLDGDYTVIVIISPFNDFMEANYSNNIQSREIDVAGDNLIINGVNVTMHGVYHYKNVSITNGGILFVTPYNGTEGTGELEIYADNVFIDPISQINGDGAGYRGGTSPYGEFSEGPGGGRGGGCSCWGPETGWRCDGGGGGGYGGNGGDGGYFCSPRWGGREYGDQSTTILDMGSGGGAGFSNVGGNGGAKIRLLVTNTTIVNGNISVNGRDGDGESGGSGGGSGGGIFIHSVDCIQLGFISAIGGNGIYGGFYDQQDQGGGGGGGGGRIKIFCSYISNIDPSKIKINGGSGNSMGGYGQDGTIVTAILVPLVISPSHPIEEKYYSNRDIRLNWEINQGIMAHYYLLDQNESTIPTASTGSYTTSTNVTFTNIADGTWYFHIVSENELGEVGTSPSNYQINIDTSAPNVSSTSHSNQTQWYQNNDPSLEWGVLHPDSIAGHYYSFDKVENTVPTNLTGTYTTSNFTSFNDIDDGTWYFHIVSVDTLGNLGNIGHYRVNVDTTAPEPVTNINATSKKHGNILLGWEEPYDAASGVYYYEIYRSEISGQIGQRITQEEVCLNGWDSYSGSCYRLTEISRSWQEANDSCTSLGWYLVTINDEAENSWLASTYSGEDRWIGLNDIVQEGNFVWAYGESNYTNWVNGEPNNWGDEDCAEIYPFGANWNDLPCSASLQGICEKNKIQSQTNTTYTDLGGGLTDGQMYYYTVMPIDYANNTRVQDNVQVSAVSNNSIVCDDFETQLCALQEGVCEGSIETCANGEWLGCTNPDYGSDYENPEASCDGLDNDCDGTVDEACFQFNIDLTQGWNLISTPLSLVNGTLPAPLSSIEGNYNVVFAYDANDVGNEWKSYNPARPGFLNTLTEITPELGYWIDMTSDDSLELQGIVTSNTTFNLKQGWNLIGYPTLTETDLEDLFAPISDDLESVFQYKSIDAGNEWKSYSPERPSFLNTLATMQPNYGYWVKVNADTSLTIP